MFGVRTWLVAAAALALAASAPLASARDYSVFYETDVPVPRTFGMPAVLAALNDTVSGERMWDELESLCMDPTRPHRVTGTPQRDSAAAWVQARYEALDGLTVTTQPFMSRAAGQSGAAVPGLNVLAAYPGRDLTRWVVVGGHYDTLPTTGCLDNGAGTVTALELARAFAETKPDLEATVVFAGWDAEEIGLFGSAAFVDDPSAMKVALGLDATAEVTILAGLSYDMNGLNWPAANPFPWYYGGDVALLNLRTSPVEARSFYERGEPDRYSEAQLLNFSRFQAVVKKVALGYLDYDARYVKVYDDNYGRSDHSPFIQAGIPGMRLQGAHQHGEPGVLGGGPTEYPPYHTYNDNMRFLERVVGKENLVAGLESSAKVGALTLAALALTGDYAASMDDADPDAPAPETTGRGPAKPNVPGFGLAVAALGALAAVAGMRRRAA